MTERCWISAILLVGASLLTLTRRYKNEDPLAGYGIAGWTILILLNMWWGHFK